MHSATTFTCEEVIPTLHCFCFPVLSFPSFFFFHFPYSLVVGSLSARFHFFPFMCNWA